MDIKSVFLSLIGTMFAYLVVPSIFLFVKIPLSRFKINIVSCIGVVIGFILISFFLLSTNSINSSVTGGGALLWTFVGNALMKKKLALEVDPSDIKWKEKEKKRCDRIEKSIKDGKYSSVEDMEKRQGVIGLVIFGVLFLLIIFFFFGLPILKG